MSSELAKYEDQFDRISAYYIHDKKLTVKETEIAERWQVGWMLLLEHRTKMTAVVRMMALYKSKGTPLSKSQAYRDLDAAEKVFAPIKQYTKEFLKLTLLESAIRDVKEAERRSRSVTTTAQWYQCMDIKNKAEYRIIQVSGLNESHPDLPDFSKIQPAQFNIVLPEGVDTFFKNLISKGSIDITKVMENLGNVSEAKEL